MHATREDVWRSAPPPPLGNHAVHVWRIRVDEMADNGRLSVLSGKEQERARRFHFDTHRRCYIVSHSATRRILGGYSGASPETLTFTEGEFGKPSLVRAPGACALEFNLSHSGDLALLAVSRGGEVGVDVERWNAQIEHLNLAEHFFSESEQQALRGLTHADELVVAGFFAAWSRKEAYLKASGHGITRGLHHFDVTLVPGDDARLVADRMDDSATERWVMRDLPVDDGYSGAVVAAAPVDEIVLLDAGGM
ncbi:MAG: 4'-phosphopantetheinyl transferase superfamily protein [bacterium]